MAGQFCLKVIYKVKVEAGWGWSYLQVWLGLEDLLLRQLPHMAAKLLLLVDGGHIACASGMQAGFPPSE